MDFKLANKAVLVFIGFFCTFTSNSDLLSWNGQVTWFNHENIALPNFRQNPKILLTDFKRLYQESFSLALQGHSKEATELLYKILQDRIPPGFADTLLLDVYDLLTVKQRKDFKRSSDKGHWLLRFWRSVDPTPATLENERYIEHCRRLEFARKYFSSPQPRGYDDRGAIYVRYGPPDDKFISSLGEFTRDNESWVYHRLGDVSFDFVEYGGLFYEVDDISRAIVTNENRLFNLVQLFEERSGLNLAYQVTAANLRMILFSRVQGGQAIMRVRDIIQQDYIARIDRIKQILPANTSDFHLDEKPLKFWISSALFGPYIGSHGTRQKREKSNMMPPNSPRLELFYSISISSILGKIRSFQDTSITVKIDAVVLDKHYDVLNRANSNVNIDNSIKSYQDYLGQLTFFLQPDTYYVALDIQSPQTNQRGMMQMQVAVPEFPQDRLSMSDIELASMVRPATEEDKERGFNKNGLYVAPYPYRVIVRQQPIFVYFEIYGLYLDESGTARYRVTYEVEQKGPSGVLALLPALNPSGGKKSSLSLSYEYTTSDRHVPQYTSLDFSGLEPGEHTLVVRVKDLVANLAVEKKVKFKLVQ